MGALGAATPLLTTGCADHTIPTNAAACVSDAEKNNGEMRLHDDITATPTQENHGVEVIAPMYDDGSFDWAQAQVVVELSMSGFKDKNPEDDKGRSDQPSDFSPRVIVAEGDKVNVPADWIYEGVPAYTPFDDTSFHDSGLEEVYAKTKLENGLQEWLLAEPGSQGCVAIALATGDCDSVFPDTDGNPATVVAMTYDAETDTMDAWVVLPGEEERDCDNLID